MALSPVELNPVCRVFFAGFQSDTYTLGSHGWDIALQDVPLHRAGRGETEMVLHHKPSGMVGTAVADRWEPMGWRQMRMENCLPEFHVRNMGNQKKVIRMGRLDPYAGFDWVETEPTITMVEERDIFTLPLFTRKAAPAAEQLIVEPATVSELLEQIRKAQAPGQAEIRERARRRELAPTLHASILTLEAA
jgi:hypothetical protein